MTKANERPTCGDWGGRTKSREPCGRPAGQGSNSPGKGRCQEHRRKCRPKGGGYEPVSRPQDWDRAVSAAFFYLIGGLKNEEIANMVGVAATTFARWKYSPFWKDVVKEAKERWVGELDAESRRTISNSVRSKEGGEPGDAVTARWVLERLDPSFAPPKQQIELTTNYMHREEVFELMRGILADVMDLLDDPAKREELAARVRRRVEPLLLGPGKVEDELEG